MPPLAGLAALAQLRMSSLPEFVARTPAEPDLGQMSMQMFYVLQALGQHEFALEMQARALTQRRLYRIQGHDRPALRLLAVMGPGDMMDNTPLEFLTRHVAVRLDLLYVQFGQPLPDVIPEHDVAMVAIGESDKHRDLLRHAGALLAHWPRPVINRPERVLNCARDRVWELLRDVPQLHVPRTRRVTRRELAAVPLPCTIRPPDTHAGHGLHRVLTSADRERCLQGLQGDEFYVSEYVDCRDADGGHRKMRVVLIDGAPYACHLAIADDWIVHYIAAQMHLSQAKRDEEARWMHSFDEDFAVRHATAFKEIAQRLGLDYIVLDCAQARDGRLLLFEADSRGWVHALDPVDEFAYKPAVMQKAFDAFAAMLARRAARDQPSTRV